MVGPTELLCKTGGGDNSVRTSKVASNCPHESAFWCRSFSRWGEKMMPVSRQPVKPAMEISAFSYQKFVRFTLEQTQSRIDLIPLPLQVLDFAVFPEPEFDLPIFCANFFTAASMNIIVLDLNPLHDVTVQREYREKYYKSLMPLGQKYVELLPWGDKITSESLRFFSPIVIWTKFTSSQYKHDVLYSAFVDYFKAWLELMDHAVAETNASQILRNQEAQHKYLTWRAEKQDPGHPILTRLIGDALAKDLVRNFLFNGVATLGSKSFLDYFPEYRCEDGTINKRRSMIGKSFETRPWDASGEYIGNEL
ncbi:phytochromobilin:ferredoxin oxidoreductase, chloroplastic isoform X5 [Magnolia sinica]|uniref:phytochromobilin:ferredoxin oxidoreductase, chloroplastic isoform X5 n=1 Tax=Magnolia sinica TaxID=86752 RepID=UPI002657DC05|nr:phytochromobilin:ferredoxin oxidoreductase, chloroplastic isoform X5 [Magnolia sinica]